MGKKQKKDEKETEEGWEREKNRTGKRLKKDGKEEKKDGKAKIRMRKGQKKKGQQAGRH
jgi:hypothetical protein